MGRAVVVALWGNGAIRVLTGFLTLFVAFVVKAQPDTDATRQLSLIGIVGAAAGIGSFAGNASGSRLRFGRSDTVIAVLRRGRRDRRGRRRAPARHRTAAVVGLVAATASAVAKVCLDAVIQRDLPEESRASAFGRSETVLQLAWVTGGALGVLLPHDGYTLGFATWSGAVVARRDPDRARRARHRAAAVPAAPGCAPRRRPARASGRLTGCVAPSSCRYSPSC